MPLVGKPSGGGNSNANAAEETKYVAQVYVNRRKVWEMRANTENEAYTKAAAEKKKYKGTNSIIVVREAP